MATIGLNYMKHISAKDSVKAQSRAELSAIPKSCN